MRVCVNTDMKTRWRYVEWEFEFVNTSQHGIASVGCSGRRTAGDRLPGRINNIAANTFDDCCVLESCLPLQSSHWLGVCQVYQPPCPNSEAAAAAAVAAAVAAAAEGQRNRHPLTWIERVYLQDAIMKEFPVNLSWQLLHNSAIQQCK